MKKILLILAVLLTAPSFAQINKARPQTVFDLQKDYDLWPSDGKLLVQDVFDMAKAKATYPNCFAIWQREKTAKGMTAAQSDAWVMGMTLFEAAYFDALYRNAKWAVLPTATSRGYCLSRNKIIIPAGDYYTRDQLDYAFNEISGSACRGGTTLRLWNDNWRGNDTDRVLMGAILDGDEGVYSYAEGINIHDLQFSGNAGPWKDPKYTITGLRAWSFGSGSGMSNVFFDHCDIGLDIVVGTPLTVSGYVGAFSCNTAGIALSGGSGATISFKTVESDDCPTLFLIRKGSTNVPAGTLLRVGQVKIEWAISPRVWKPEAIVVGSGWMHMTFGSISYASAHGCVDALFNLKPDVNSSFLHVGDLRGWGGSVTKAILHDDIAKKTWLYDVSWTSKIMTFDWSNDPSNNLSFRSWPGTAQVVDAPHQGRLGGLGKNEMTGQCIGTFDRTNGKPAWSDILGDGTFKPTTAPPVVVPPVVVPPVIVPPVVPPASKDTIAYFTFDGVSKSNINATVGQNMLAIYSVGAMTEGTLDNSGKNYINYFSYPVQWKDVQKVTLKGVTFDNHGGVLMTDSAGTSYLRIMNDGSVIQMLPGYDKRVLLPKGTVKLNAPKIDLTIALAKPMSIHYFGQRTGQGGGWSGTMEGLLIQ